MPNTITVTIPFSFKGIEHKPSLVVDLDGYVLNHENFDMVYHLVATENNIDRYSYEFEVMESIPCTFSNPTGDAVNFLNENTFDLVGFKKRIEEKKILSVIQEIAHNVLNIDNIEDDANEAIKRALFQAYQVGTKNKV